ncbi:MAG: prefoldin subunit beta [Thermoprotei archaeon]|nr:prefoldin subunit beta [Thermoprotei archaeon]
MSSIEQLPPRVQQQLARLAQVQEMLSNIVARRQQWEAELREVESAINELNKVSEDTPVYKSVGMLLIRTDKSSALADLTDKKETIDLRIKTLQRQEGLLKKQLDDLKKRVSDELSKLRGSSGA